MMRITRIREKKEGDRHRVEARADMPVWFESSEVRLRPSPEAFGSALLLPALGLRKRLRMEEPVSPVWYANVEKLLEIFHEWWGLPPWAPQAELAEEAKGERAAQTALCFSGGGGLVLHAAARRAEDRLAGEPARIRYSGEG